jgi:hypothetical protein
LYCFPPAQQVLYFSLPPPWAIRDTFGFHCCILDISDKARESLSLLRYNSENKPLVTLPLIVFFVLQIYKSNEIKLIERAVIQIGCCEACFYLNSTLLYDAEIWYLKPIRVSVHPFNGLGIRITQVLINTCTLCWLEKRVSVLSQKDDSSFLLTFPYTSTYVKHPVI